MKTPYIPPKTAAKLAETHPKGTRHLAAMDIAIPLIGNGMSPAAVFAQLRSQFESDVSDKELEDIIKFAVSKSPTPSGHGGNGSKIPFSRPMIVAKPVPQKTPVEQAVWWLNGFRITSQEFISRSQIAVPANEVEALRLTLELIYVGTDCLNVMTTHDLLEGKARPKGGGRISTRDAWLDYLTEHPIPRSAAGAWFRPNPVKEAGSGAGGAVTDSDVVAFRFLLVESDILPLETQFALYAKFKLPITVVVASGALSAHAWVRIDAKTLPEYESKARRILTALAPFGFDQLNKNPSRLSRLPGAVRTIGAVNGGVQSLLWLNPGRHPLSDKDLDEFEESLLIPATEEKPFKRLIEEAIPRYEYLIANRGKLGCPTGLARFDKVSGGLKPGGYTLLAAETGVGKTTLCLNIINAALKHGVGVALFSLEMTREDVTDMLFSMNCNVDRNGFNTGDFLDCEVKRMVEGTIWMKDLPLWINDDPAMTMDKIRKQVFALRRDAGIGLVAIDYAQLVVSDERIDNREQAVAAVALGVRLMSREANVPVLILSQLNDDLRVRESRKLAHEASTVFFLKRKSEKDLTDKNMVLIISKGRKIPSDPIELKLEPQFCRITETHPVEPGDIPRPVQDVPRYSGRPYADP